MTTLVAPVQPIVPEEAKFGLFSLGAPTGEADDRWTSGFSYETETCSMHLRNRDFCNQAVTSDVYVPVTGTCLAQTFTPYYVQVDDPRTTFGFGAMDYEGRVRRALDACSQRAVENELWTGSIARVQSYPNRYLASVDTNQVAASGTPVKVRYGLALLEKAIGSCGCGGPGVIHTTRDVASVLPLKADDNGVLRTVLGNAVVAGNGYTGSGPDGVVTPGVDSWMYATGPIAYRLGPVEVFPDQRSQAIDTRVNRFNYSAQRAAAATWDGCCHYGVRVDLSLDYA